MSLLPVWGQRSSVRGGDIMKISLHDAYSANDGQRSGNGAEELTHSETTQFHLGTVNVARSGCV